jgi:toxin ParE1/3/4
MLNFVIAPAAAADMAAILSWSEDHFGAAARRRYEALLEQAIVDVAGDPERAGSQHRPEIAEAARTYHLLQSRDRVPVEIGRVKEPRHSLLFRVRSDGAIEIGRVLHDSMDLARHLPGAYRP